jgi:hypothetical protein
VVHFLTEVLPLLGLVELFRRQEGKALRLAAQENTRIETK